MKLHTDPQTFRDAVTATSQQLNIPEIYIEKDYWVTLALHTIFHSEFAGHVVFKGGTALSKCYKLIERFSEDVDLVLLKKVGESANQQKNRLKAITDSVSKLIPEIEIEGITNKKGMIRKTAHQYSKQQFSGAFGQIREQLIIEVTWLGSSEPYIKAELDSYIADMMISSGQMQLIDEYGLRPFEVNVLSMERTFCEKIMSLVRFSQAPDPYFDLSNKIRHIYDLHQLLKTAEISQFLLNPSFDDLLKRVGEDDLISYRNNNDWLRNHPKEAVIFSDAAGSWDKIKTTYRTVFKDLVTGNLPVEEALVTTLNTIHTRLAQLDWDIK